MAQTSFEPVKMTSRREVSLGRAEASMSARKDMCWVEEERSAEIRTDSMSRAKEGSRRIRAMMPAVRLARRRSIWYEARSRSFSCAVEEAGEE